MILRDNGTIFIAVNAYYRNPNQIYVMIFHTVDKYGVTTNTNIIELGGAQVYFTNIARTTISSNCIICGSTYNPTPQQAMGLCMNMETLTPVSSWGTSGFIYGPVIQFGSSFKGVAVNPNDGSAMFLGQAYISSKPDAYSFITYKVDINGAPVTSYGSLGFAVVNPPPTYSQGSLEGFTPSGNGVVQFDISGNEVIIAPALSDTGPTGLQVEFCGLGHSVTGIPHSITPSPPTHSMTNSLTNQHTDYSTDQHTNPYTNIHTHVHTNPSTLCPYKPLDSCPYKPLDSCPYKPLDSCLYKPLDSCPYKPLDSCPYKPLDSCPYKPLDSCPYKPLDSCLYKPLDSCPYKPLDSCPYKLSYSYCYSPIEAVPVTVLKLIPNS